VCCVGLRLLKLLRTRLYLLFWALALGVSGSASAHAYLVDTTPQAGERLQVLPSEVVLRFSEPIVEGMEQVTIRTAGGTDIPVTGLAPIDGGLRVRAALPGLGKGVYSIT
jgi:methionine-rich copper-binding protein CopC